MFGIIPACAGNTRDQSGQISASRDHPRVCGEHTVSACRCASRSGSSPRVRGTLHDPRRPVRHPGIIPACAGNTAVVSSAWLLVGDHPRVCGEHEVS